MHLNEFVIKTTFTAIFRGGPGPPLMTLRGGPVGPGPPHQSAPEIELSIIQLKEVHFLQPSVSKTALQGRKVKVQCSSPMKVQGQKLENVRV